MFSVLQFKIIIRIMLYVFIMFAISISYSILATKLYITDVYISGVMYIFIHWSKYWFYGTDFNKFFSSMIGKIFIAANFINFLFINRSLFAKEVDFSNWALVSSCAALLIGWCLAFYVVLYNIKRIESQFLIWILYVIFSLSTIYLYTTSKFSLTYIILIPQLFITILSNQFITKYNLQHKKDYYFEYHAMRSQSYILIILFHYILYNHYQVLVLEEFMYLYLTLGFIMHYVFFTKTKSK